MSAPAGFRRRYGASPLHLLLVLVSFALAVYAGLRLFEGDTLGVAVWFVGAALLHDLVLLPLYSVTDRAAQALFTRGSGPTPPVPRVSVNYVRVPAFVSGVLLLVWWPLVFRRVEHYTAATALPADGFLGRWLLVTGALFAASAVVLAVRTRHWSRAQRQARSATK
ncbi:MULTISPECIES: hypothetical protein [unclassified Streptomyces]|uniref:hypothetical protein n=1 Tax=unclassified Streptomyces TaxID=2593676 RepID=UPI00332CDAB6